MQTPRRAFLFKGRLDFGNLEQLTTTNNMSLEIYNTLSRKQEAFKSIEPGQSQYVRLRGDGIR